MSLLIPSLHLNLTCPACGWTFPHGLTRLNGEGTGEPDEKICTVCSKCLTVLDISNPHQPRIMSTAEVNDLPEDERRGITFVLMLSTLARRVGGPKGNDA